MYYVSEQAVQDCVTQAQVTEAISNVFSNLANQSARNFPVVRETLGHANAVFGFKSGFDRDQLNLGVKAGGLWPGNRLRGMANHQSTIVLFDTESGAPRALVRGTYLTALRTAAASALSVRYLARQDVTTLGIIGTGGQAQWQLRAALAERTFAKVLISDRNPGAAHALVDQLSEIKVTCEVVPVEALVRASDVLITVTPSRAPLFEHDWVRSGTHLACMGTDTIGKQEIPITLVASASLFGDQPEQAVTLGECQHAAKSGAVDTKTITTLGQVITTQHPGRQDHDEITLFDSTGMGLQDLAAAQLALEQAQQAGLVIELPD
ncbi:MAG: ornithine cyclodeaminase family protein [Pseudomonadota bacterium]